MFFINHTDLGEGSAAIIEVEGPLNSDSAPDFDDYISKLVDNNVICVLIDMQNLNFISSEGIGALLMIQKSIDERNGLAVFFNVNYEIKSLFKLLGFTQVFTIAADRADALNMLDRHMELFPDESQSLRSDSLLNAELSLTDDKSEISDFENSDRSPSDDFEEFNNLDEFDNFDGSDDFDGSNVPVEPFVIECIQCRSLIRVKESGEQLCPYCNAGFTVSEGKKAVFKIHENN